MEDYKQLQLKLVDLNWDGNEGVEEYPSFKSFTSRMWLDYCDENNTAQSNHMTRDEYVERWYDWLLEKYQNRDYREDGII